MTVSFSLGEVATIVDCEHKTAPPASTGEEFGYAVGTRSLQSGKIQFSNAKRVSRYTFDAWSRRAVLGYGDLILAREAPVGQVAFVTGEVPVCLGQRTVLIRVDQSKIDPAYLHRYLLGPSAQGWMASRSEGSTVSHLNVSDVRLIPLDDFPPLAEQTRIASVLGELDELIETNEKLGRNLRTQARQLFFAAKPTQRVEFQQIARLVTERVPVKDFVGVEQYLGLDAFETDGGGIAEIGSSQGLSGPQVRFAAGDCLFGKLRPYFRKFDRPGFDGLCTPEIWVLRAQDGFTNAFVDSVAASDQFSDAATQGSGGTRMPRADWSHLKSLRIDIPSFEEMNRISAVSDALWEGHWALRVENNELLRTRNELLPLLLSGRVFPGRVAA